MNGDDDATLDGDTLGGEAAPKGGAASTGSAPARVGSYEIVSELGRGGMGEVYEAWDARLRRRVALKRVARPQRGVAEARARFWREARALAAVEHPGIVTIYDMGETDEGDLFLAMELVAGRPLRDFTGGCWPAAAAAALGVQLGEALGAAHAAGITHRDVKPANVIIEPDGRARLVDFGLARRADAAEDAVTVDGAVVGTVAYMAPEQLAGESVDPTADVFAVGVLLFRLLAGRHPFARESTSATALAVAAAAHAPLSEVAPEVPEPLVAVVTRCLARERGDRYQSGQALADALADAARRAELELDATTVAAFLAGVPEFELELGTADTSFAPLASSHLASQTRRARRGIAWVAVIGAAVLLALGGWAAWDRTAAETEEPLAASEPGGAARADAVDLPPRPTLAVLGAAEAEGTEGAVFTDALRSYLDLAPTRLVVLPLAAMWERGEVTPEPDAAVWARPGRALGHVDALLRTSVNEGGATIALVRTRDGLEVARWTLPGASGKPVALAREAARLVVTTLGGEWPDQVPALTRDPDAYAAYLRSLETSRTGDADLAQAELVEALRRDPGFELARFQELAVLRAKRRLDDMATRGEALLADTPTLAPRLRSLTEAWIAYARHDGAGTLAKVAAHLERWPLDVDAYLMALVVRFHDPRQSDFAAAEELARDLLAIAPRSQTALSRLVRSLAWRGRVGEARDAVEALGMPRDDAGFAEIWGELALYGGEYDEAKVQFRRSLAADDGGLYATHMLWATHILAGECELAQRETMDRIDRVEATQKDANLDWTYALSLQSLLCRGRWKVARAWMERWAGRGAGGAWEAPMWRPRIALAEGQPTAAIAESLVEALGGELRPDLLWILARASDDPETLRRFAKEAESASLDPERGPGDRTMLQQAAVALAAAADVLVPGATEEAWRVLDGIVPDPTTARHEAELANRVSAMAVRATLLERGGRGEAAAQAWAAITSLAYPRLWSGDMVFMARRRASPD